MADNALITISSIEEGDISRDRIVDGDSIPDELFCPICQCLLWKPRSCASCQHLFCQKCVQRWLENPNSGKSCPFRCQTFEDRRCPPSIQSILSRINIHCRNSEFGCSETVRYDQLENHEYVQCQYLTKQCSECNKLILVSKYDEHQQTPGFCIPCPIQCTICRSSFEKSLFREHFHQCCQKRIIQLNQIEMVRRLLTGQPMTPPSIGETWFRNTGNTMELIEEQRRNFRLPTSLKGVDSVRRAREQNCDYFYHALMMLKFVVLNWSKIPFFLYTFTSGGFFAFGILVVHFYRVFACWAYQNIYYGPILISICSSLLSCGISRIFQSVSDSIIIICLCCFMFLYWICILRVHLEMLETEALFNRPMLSTVFCGVGLLIIKLILLLIRFYHGLIPMNDRLTLFTVLNFYVAYTQRNQQTQRV